MNSFLYSSIAVAVISILLAVVSIRFKNRKLGLFAISLAMLGCIFFLTLGMDGLRAHVMQMRAQGVSEEFVKGMIARDHHLFKARVAEGLSILGLFIVAVLMRK